MGDYSRKFFLVFFAIQEESQPKLKPTLLACFQECSKLPGPPTRSSDQHFWILDWADCFRSISESPPPPVAKCVCSKRILRKTLSTIDRQIPSRSSSNSRSTLEPPELQQDIYYTFGLLKHWCHFTFFLFWTSFRPAVWTARVRSWPSFASSRSIPGRPSPLSWQYQLRQRRRRRPFRQGCQPRSSWPKVSH